MNAILRIGYQQLLFDTDLPTETLQKTPRKKEGGAGHLALPAQRKQHLLTLK